MYIPEQTLAFRVIMQAVMDASGNDARANGRNMDKIEARKFLLGSTKAWRESLLFWSEAAKIHIDRITKAAKKMEANDWPRIPKGLVRLIENGTADTKVLDAIMKGGEL